MTRQLFSVLSLIFMFGCKPSQECPEINSLPMFGGLKKCDKQLEADSIFLTECNKFYKNRNEATQHYIDWAWSYYYKDKLDSSMMRFNQAWLLDSTNADVYWGFGNILGRQQKFQESLIYFDRSLAINSKNSKVWVSSATSYGQMFFQSKDTSLLNKAIDNLKESVSIDPTNAEAYAQLTACYSYYMQQDSARKYLEITDRLDPKAINPDVRQILNKK